MEEAEIKQLLISSLLEQAEKGTSEQVLQRINAQREKGPWKLEHITHALLAILLLATGFLLLEQPEMRNNILLFAGAVATLSIGVWAVLFVQQREIKREQKSGLFR